MDPWRPHKWKVRRHDSPVTRRQLTPTRRLGVGLIGLGVVVVCGTAGYVGLGFNVLDALFQTVTTVTTVGFGEVHKFSGAGEVFTILLILVGVGTAAYTLGVLLETLVEGQLSDLVGRRRMEQKIAAMEGHVVVCGWGRVGRALGGRLTGTGHDVVVVDSAADRVSALPLPYVLGDATDDSVLRASGIERARVLVTVLNSDAANLYVTLTARSLCPHLFIVARADNSSAVPKLHQAGANRVVNPTEIGGARMAAFAVQPHVAEFVDVVMHDGSLDFYLEEVRLPADSPLAGETLRSTRLHERTGTLVLAMRDEAGNFRTNPSSAEKLRANEILIVIGTNQQIDTLKSFVRPGPETDELETTQRERNDS